MLYDQQQSEKLLIPAVLKIRHSQTKCMQTTWAPFRQTFTCVRVGWGRNCHSKSQLLKGWGVWLEIRLLKLFPITHIYLYGHISIPNLQLNMCGEAESALAVAPVSHMESLTPHWPLKSYWFFCVLEIRPILAKKSNHSADSSLVKWWNRKGFSREREILRAPDYMSVLVFPTLLSRGLS